MIRVDASTTYQAVHGFGVTIPSHGDEQSPVYDRDFFELLVGDLGCDAVRTPFLTQEGDTPDSHLLDLQAGDLHELRTLKPEIKILATMSSPPAFMKDGQRLKDGCETDLAAYVLDMCSEFKQRNCPVYAVGLQNGPSTGPSMMHGVPFGPLSYCVYDAGSYLSTFREICRQSDTRGDRVRLIASEDEMFCLPRVADFIDAIISDGETAGRLDFIGARGHMVTSWESVDVVRQGIPGAVVADIYPYANGAFKNSVARYDRVCLLLEDCRETPVWKVPVDYGIQMTPRDPEYFGLIGTSAIDLALKIRAAFVEGNFSSYVYWLATTAPGLGEPSEALCVDGRPTPKYQAAKHFFKYIDPGMTRIDAQSDELSVCAFKSGGRVVVVAVNDSEDIVDTDMEVTGIAPRSYTSYSSVENDYHQPESGAVRDGAVELTMLPNSISTFVVE